MEYDLAPSFDAEDESPPPPPPPTVDQHAARISKTLSTNSQAIREVAKKMLEMADESQKSHQSDRELRSRDPTKLASSISSTGSTPESNKKKAHFSSSSPVHVVGAMPPPNGEEAMDSPAGQAGVQANRKDRAHRTKSDKDRKGPKRTTTNESTKSNGSTECRRQQHQQALLDKKKQQQGLDVDSKHMVGVSERVMAVESEAQNLKLDEWMTAKDNDKAFRAAHTARTYQNIFFSEGKLTFDWTEHLVYTVIALVIQFVLGHAYCFPDGLWDETQRACTDKEGGHWNENMCGLLVAVERARLSFRFLTPFILGGYVASTVALWRQRRTNYLALCGATRNMNVNLASILPLPKSSGKCKTSSLLESQRKATATDMNGSLMDEEERYRRQKKVAHARKTLSRWSLLGYELSVLKARGQIDQDDYAIPHLIHMGLLKEGEWEAMVPGDRHTTVWYWLQTKVVALGEEGILPTIHVQTICTAVTLIRDRANDMMSSLSYDQPFPYASICGLLVNITLLLEAAWKGVVRTFADDAFLLHVSFMSTDRVSSSLLFIGMGHLDVRGRLCKSVHRTKDLYRDSFPLAFQPHVGNALRLVAHSLQSFWTTTLGPTSCRSGRWNSQNGSILCLRRLSTSDYGISRSHGRRE